MPFPTIADDAKQFAEAAAKSFRDRQYTIKEKLVNGPIGYVPTFFATRQHEVVICEIMSSVDLKRLYTCRAFAKTRKSDTRVEILLLPAGRITKSEQSALKQWGFGLQKFNKELEVLTILTALDQTLNPDLPPPSEFPQKHRAKFGKAYDHFNKAEWIPGFDASCSVLEQLARKYLWKGIHSGRITFVKPTGAPVVLTKSKVDKMPIGPLADHFDMIVSKTAADSEIGLVLRAVNPARRHVAHGKGTASSDRIVRNRVETDMWSILSAIQHIG